MSLRSAVITCAVVSVLGIAGLIAVGAADQRRTAFSADVQAAAPQVVLRSGQQACESALYASASFGSVTAWVMGESRPGAALQMRIRSVHGATLATGQIPAGYVGSSAPTFRLNRTVVGSQSIIVCVRSAGPKPAGVLGANGQFTLVFLRPHPISLLSSVSAIFTRAALFRPSWVGPWTFWVLLAGLLAALVAGGVAVAMAVRAEAEIDEQLPPIDY